VTSKSSIREWNNAKGSGRLFNVDFIDESVSSLCPVSAFLYVFLSSINESKIMDNKQGTCIFRVK
jgi:hypothetical protein